MSNVHPGRDVILLEAFDPAQLRVAHPWSRMLLCSCFIVFLLLRTGVQYFKYVMLFTLLNPINKRKNFVKQIPIATFHFIE